MSAFGVLENFIIMITMNVGALFYYGLPFVTENLKQKIVGNYFRLLNLLTVLAFPFHSASEYSFIHNNMYNTFAPEKND